ncbi:MAG TPA: AbrB/MazE/SpoVT family DNA-binding domain-containing protein [Candidatus Nanoarchaeia archaeon]|nr:AbrB/MazE/SpoVT family DNA-binding domain-containing protein [Candidatus Nanoarchaeia archaeon]
MVILLEEKRRVGPKGQIVIPQALRKVKGIVPGDVVRVYLDKEGIMIDKDEEKTEEVFDQMAKSIRGKKRDWSKVDWHLLHEERMKEYMKKKGW